MTTQTTIGCCTLYLGDCRALLPGLPGRQEVTVQIVDPPYGVRSHQKRSRDKWVHPETEQPMIAGDDGPFDPTHLLQLKIPRMILWGANHYSHRLPPSAHWLIWDKRKGARSDDNADCELAWTNLPGPARLFAHKWRGAVRDGEDNYQRSGKKLHQHQKPPELMAWCLEQARVTPADVVLDPYMGVASLGLVCLRRGIPYIGIEIAPAYYESAVKRLQQEARTLQYVLPWLGADPPTPGTPLRGWGGDRKSAAFLAHQGDNGAAQNGTLKRGNGRAYLLARLCRDHPALFAAWQRGEYPSMRAAARAAGLVKGKTAPTERQAEHSKAALAPQCPRAGDQGAGSCCQLPAPIRRL